MLPTSADSDLRPIIAPLVAHKDWHKALHMHELLWRPSCFESPLTEQLGESH